MNLNRFFRKRIKNNFIYAAILLLLAFVKCMPRKASLALARGLAVLGYRLARGERRKMEANLNRAFGDAYSPEERFQIGEAVFQTVAQNLVDAILVPRLLNHMPEEIIAFDGLDILQSALAEKKGLICLTAHTGCFEMMPPRLSQLGFPLHVMGARIYDERLNQIIIRSRKGFNVGYIERGENIRPLIAALKQGHCFGVLCDLDTRADSQFITFFGAPAKTISGPFMLGIRLNVPLIPVFALRRPDGTQKVIVYPRLQPEGRTVEEQITSAMTLYNGLLEEFVRKNPTQWIWMHERWKSQP